MRSPASHPAAETVVVRVIRWGEGPGVRLPASVVEALDLKEGEDIELHVIEERARVEGRNTGLTGRLVRLRRLRGKLPKDFRVDRFERGERD